jgi:ankyrin repeat protein
MQKLFDQGSKLIGAGDEAGLLLFLKHHHGRALARYTNASDESLLHLAAGQDMAKACERLLALGSKVNENTGDDRVPLHDAARGGAAKACRVLLAAGAKVEVLDCSDASPLIWALAGRGPGHREVAQQLVAAGADANRALCHAALMGERRAFEAAIEVGGNAFDEALYKCCFGCDGLVFTDNYGAIARLAIAHGGDVHQRFRISDVDDVTLLHLAVMNKCAPIVCALLEGGADMDAVDRHGRKPYPHPDSNDDEANDIRSVLLAWRARERARQVMAPPVLEPTL